MTRPNEQLEEVLELYRAGLNHCQIARLTGVPRSTVRSWTRPAYARRTRRLSQCFRCGGPSVDVSQYAYLLGLYLGDGYLVISGRDTWRLSIYQDARYVRLIWKCVIAIRAVASREAKEIRRGGCVQVCSDWKHWLHVFPQHGIGRKHERRIALEPWQAALVEQSPKAFLAGLIESDGCRFLNPIRHTVAGAPHQYSYVRYVFTNASDDIRRLFTDTCDGLGVRWKQTSARVVAVSRRSDVAFLDTFIGPKS